MNIVTHLLFFYKACFDCLSIIYSCFNLTVKRNKQGVSEVIKCAYKDGGDVDLPLSLSLSFLY